MIHVAANVADGGALLSTVMPRGQVHTRATPDDDGGQSREDRTVDRTVLIVDDHSVFRRAARELLEADGFEVVGEAETGETAIRLVEQLGPTIVLLDIQLPDTDGFAVAARLASGPTPPVVVLISSREAAAYGDRVARANAAGFISKVRLSGAALAEIVG